MRVALGVGREGVEGIVRTCYLLELFYPIPAGTCLRYPGQLGGRPFVPGTCGFLLAFETREAAEAEQARQGAGVIVEFDTGDLPDAGEGQILPTEQQEASNQ